MCNINDHNLLKKRYLEIFCEEPTKSELREIIQEIRHRFDSNLETIIKISTKFGNIEVSFDYKNGNIYSVKGKKYKKEIKDDKIIYTDCKIIYGEFTYSKFVEYYGFPPINSKTHKVKEEPDILISHNYSLDKYEKDFKTIEDIKK